MKRNDLITPESLERVKALAQSGMSNKQIAEELGIALSTFYEWKKRFSEFSKSIKKGSGLAVRIAEGSLEMAAGGYTYDEVTRKTILDPLTGEPKLDENGEQRMVVTQIVTKVAHPNVTALIFLLKNKDPENWSDRKPLTAPEVVGGDFNI